MLSSSPASASTTSPFPGVALVSEGREGREAGGDAALHVAGAAAAKAAVAQLAAERAHRPGKVLQHRIGVEVAAEHDAPARALAPQHGEDVGDAFRQLDHLDRGGGHHFAHHGGSLGGDSAGIERRVG
jgi:hypothetical protein